MKFWKNKQRGSTIVIVLILLAAISVGSVYLISMNSIRTRTSKASNVYFGADNIRNQVMMTLLDPYAWEHTLKYSGNATTFACVLTGTSTCNNGEVNNGPAAGSWPATLSNGTPGANAGAFTLIDKAGNIATPYYDETVPTAGFDIAGNRCNTWSAAGDLTCVYRVMLYWVPANANTVNDMMRVIGYIIYSPKLASGATANTIAFNPANYMIEAVLPPFVAYDQAPNKMTTGTVTASIGSNTYNSCSAALKMTLASCGYCSDATITPVAGNPQPPYMKCSMCSTTTTTTSCTVSGSVSYFTGYFARYANAYVSQNGGYFYASVPGTSCTTACRYHGGCNISQTRDYAGSGNGSMAACTSLLSSGSTTGFSFGTPTQDNASNSKYLGMGCFHFFGTGADPTPADVWSTFGVDPYGTTCDTSYPGASRICGCNGT